MEQSPPPLLARVRAWWGWFQKKTESKHAPLAVFVWSFLNPLLVPFPAESLLAPIALANRRRALYLTMLASVATALGAAVGYFLAVFLYDALVLPFLGSDIEAGIRAFAETVEPWALFWIIFIAALTLIPDPPFIAAAGLLSVDFSIFIIAFFLGRTLRFIIVIGLVVMFGERAWLMFEKTEHKAGVLIVLTAVTVLMAVALFSFLHG